MNGFHSRACGMSSHDSARTGGKKTANSTEGKTIGAGGRERYAKLPRSMRAGHWSIGVLALAVLASAAPAAWAGCGGVERRQPFWRSQRYRPPLIIGDSVLLGAMPDVARAGFEVNARGCRGWDEGRHVVWARRHAHTLPHLVVMQLGTDWSVRVGQIRSVLDLVGRRRVLGLVTPREAGGFGGPDAESMRRAARRWPGRVALVDWARDTRAKHGWFAPDGIHLSYAGAAGLARHLKPLLAFRRPPAMPAGNSGA